MQCSVFWLAEKATRTLLYWLNTSSIWDTHFIVLFIYKKKKTKKTCITKGRSLVLSHSKGKWYCKMLSWKFLWLKKWRNYFRKLLYKKSNSQYFLYQQKPVRKKDWFSQKVDEVFNLCQVSSIKLIIYNFLGLKNNTTHGKSGVWKIGSSLVFSLVCCFFGGMGEGFPWFKTEAV